MAGHRTVEIENNRAADKVLSWPRLASGKLDAFRRIPASLGKCVPSAMADCLNLRSPACDLLAMRTFSQGIFMATLEPGLLPTLFRRLWPTALICCGLVFTVFWGVFLGYRLFVFVLRVF